MGTRRQNHITPVLANLQWLPVHFHIIFKILQSAALNAAEEKIKMQRGSGCCSGNPQTLEQPATNKPKMEWWAPLAWARKHMGRGHW